MKFLITIFFLLQVSLYAFGQDTYTCKNVKLNIYAPAPFGDVNGTSITGISSLNTSVSDLSFSVQVKTFKFEKTLMEQHFNEKYMESGKYPTARFKGKIAELPDLKKDGIYHVTATGELEIHGTSQMRSIPGTLTIKDGNITLNAEFTVKCVDHHIEIPKLVFHKIAESVQVKLQAVYEAKK